MGLTGRRAELAIRLAVAVPAVNCNTPEKCQIKPRNQILASAPLALNTHTLTLASRPRNGASGGAARSSDDARGP